MAGFDALNAEAECLYSTVRNVSPFKLFFGFLPPHGRSLDSGESFSFWGDIQSWLNRYTPNGRARRSFQNALMGPDGKDDAAVLALVATPSVHLYDAVTDYTKILHLSNSVLSGADPCWNTYKSSTSAQYDDTWHKASFDA